MKKRASFSIAGVPSGQNREGDLVICMAVDNARPPYTITLMTDDGTGHRVDLSEIFKAWAFLGTYIATHQYAPTKVRAICNSAAELAEEALEELAR